MTLDTTRLHVSPLTPDLLPVVLGSTFKSAAQNISYHELQTYPEKNYGFIELPTADAAQFKKKLSGAILKGTKMKVEEARPKKSSRRTVQDTEPARGADSSLKTKRKRKVADDDVMTGHLLSPERKVQRGWTEARKEKRGKKDDAKTERQHSKYTDKDELLFRTRVPPNKSNLVLKKSKQARKARHGAEEHTVHEFEKTTSEPSFLKHEQAHNKTSLEYVDGKGWVDEHGNVVEGEPSSVKRKRTQSKRTVTTGPSSKKAQKPPTEGKGHLAVDRDADTDSPSMDSSSSDDNAEQDSGSTGSSSRLSTPKHTLNAAGNANVEPLKAHPLETIFKKPQKPVSQDVAKPSLEVSTAFSFFGGGTDDIEDEPEIPLTPFTSQEMRNRGLRSAAPTPDTAYPSRFNSYDSAGLTEGELSEEDGDESEAKGGGPREPSPKQLRSASKHPSGTSNFEKMFWDKRGDNNRAWKARRRAVLKDKRHRENRARRPKTW
ncbi:uncharacterized protein HMPREF1541_05030 [Cyphellophora europaea CBS 101466]|uniref:Uncharacterized protein n=1 Tax=Cyphellophora europaea (strain CBS 101466) TaxID=1220924 RepID=W2RWP3_CYPE1|nr:uncharacterized protein HMPREF1541_05030 [Cyphellophora europaea CBS 101466]ETN40750.1 hypothetical protein HMPREF1541_05030 [Cyphellophora europaea CBS 101466]